MSRCECNIFNVQLNVDQKSASAFTNTQSIIHTDSCNSAFIIAYEFRTTCHPFVTLLLLPLIELYSILVDFIFHYHHKNFKN